MQEGFFLRFYPITRAIQLEKHWKYFKMHFKNASYACYCFQTQFQSNLCHASTKLLFPIREFHITLSCSTGTWRRKKAAERKHPTKHRPIKLSLKFLCHLLCLQLLDNPVQHLPSSLKLQVSPSHLAVHFLQVLREIGMGIVIILLSYWQAQVPSITLENKQDFTVCFVLVFQARALVAPIYVFKKDQCIHIQAPHALTFCTVTGLLPHVLCSTSFPPS